MVNTGNLFLHYLATKNGLLDLYFWRSINKCQEKLRSNLSYLSFIMKSIFLGGYIRYSIRHEITISWLLFIVRYFDEFCFDIFECSISWLRAYILFKSFGAKFKSSRRNTQFQIVARRDLQFRIYKFFFKSVLYRSKNSGFHLFFELSHDISNRHIIYLCVNKNREKDRSFRWPGLTNDGKCSIEEHGVGTLPYTTGTVWYGIEC